MGIRFVTLLLAIAPGLVLAQAPAVSPSGAAASDRAALIKSLQRGKEIRGSGGQYRVLPELQAAEKNASTETPEQAVTRVGAGGSQIVDTKGRLVLYRSAQKKEASVERVAGSRVYPTVLNVRSGTLGVLTGTLIVKPKNLDDAGAIGSSHGLETVKVFPQLQTVFYKARPQVDIADLSAALQADPRVESAYPEIIEHIRTPR